MCNSVGKNGFLPPSKRHGVFDVFSKGGPKNVATFPKNSDTVFFHFLKKKDPSGGPKNTKKGLKTGQKHEKTAKKHEKSPKNSLKSRKNTPKTGHFRLFSKSVPEFDPKTAKMSFFKKSQTYRLFYNKFKNLNIKNK